MASYFSYEKGPNKLVEPNIKQWTIHCSILYCIILYQETIAFVFNLDSETIVFRCYFVHQRVLFYIDQKTVAFQCYFVCQYCLIWIRILQLVVFLTQAKICVFLCITWYTNVLCLWYSGNSLNSNNAHGRTTCDQGVPQWCPAVPK